MPSGTSHVTLIVDTVVLYVPVLYHDSTGTCNIDIGTRRNTYTLLQRVHASDGMMVLTASTGSRANRTEYITLEYSTCVSVLSNSQRLE